MFLSRQLYGGFLAMGIIFACACTSTQAAQGFHIAPHLNNITQDGATLIWESKEADKGVVNYGQNGNLDHSAAGKEGETLQRVRIEGLEAETTYQYQIACGEESFEGVITTAPATARPITFILVGDSRRWGTRWEETKMEAHADQWEPEFYLTMGDLVPSGHNYDQWPEHFNRFKTLNGRLWMVTARGNHEGSQVFKKEQDWFAKYHELPGDGEPFADFTWGNTHFSLISFEQTASKATVDWLDDNLPKQDAKWKIAAHHFPVYCTGYESPIDKRKEMGTSTFKPLADALDRNNVVMDLAGHTHIYERLHSIRAGKRDDENGTLYVVNGGDIGANYPDWFTATNDNGKPYDQPTYTVFHMGDDRVWFRTFCWSKVDNKIIEIDYHIIWRDEAVPRAELAKLDSATGDAKRQVVVELGALSYAPAAPKLIPLLASENTALRRAAATAIRQIGTESVANALTDYLGDADLHVRQEAARALEIAMTPDVTGDVITAILDSTQDPKVRETLLGALQFHGEPAKSTKLLLDLIRDTDTVKEVRERAVYALTHTAGQSDIDTVIGLFRVETDPYVLARLTFTMNKLSGRIQNPDPKSAIGRSKPGEGRDKYIKKWRAWMEKEAAKKAA
jgi:hypothetical protein